MAVLEASVMGWDLKYPEGHPNADEDVPINEETIGSLAAPVVDELCEAITLLNHVWSKEDEENLREKS